MRNLKRVLSLALAVMMLIGMMVVGANAAGIDDFSDKDEIVNKDAVSMLTILGVINGKEDGSYYAPKDNVTRAEMAKMIATILNQGADVNDLYANLNTGLKDIDNSWAKGYINYCYSLGIIAGRGDGTFDPTAPVTGNEAAKMLLVAIGYDPAIEGLTGSTWAIKTTALASTLGIFDDLTAPTQENLNRDNAALLIYNALDVEMIQKYEDGYAIAFEDSRTLLSNKYGVYKVEGVVTANKWAALNETDSDAALRDGKTTLDNVVVYSSTTSNTTVGEGVAEKAPVTFNVDTPVNYMGKAVTMYIKKTTILANSTVLGVTVNDNVNVINTTTANNDTAAKYLKGTGVTTDKDTEWYVNYGYCANETVAYNAINAHTEYASKNKFNLNGIKVEVIDNNDDGVAEYVLYTLETLAEVQAYSAKNETISFYTPYDANGKLATAGSAVVSEKVDFEDAVFEGEYETGDLILYVQYGGRTYITNPEIVTGKMTRVDRDTNNELYITVEGEEYRQSYILDAASLVDVDVTHFNIGNANVEPGFDTTYDFILDSTGKYVVAIRPAEDSVKNYGLVLGSAWTQNALTKSGEIKILKTDSTEEQYTINWKGSVGSTKEFANDAALEDYLGTRDVLGGKNTGAAVGTVIQYTVNDSNQLTIVDVLGLNDLTADGKFDSTAANGGVNSVDTPAYITYNNAASQNRNLQYTVRAVDGKGYEAEDGTLNLTATGLGDVKYAVDLDTVAFYYVNSSTYGVAVGWDDMGDINPGTYAQVYNVVAKDNAGGVKATDLVDVVLFNALPEANSNNYMLVLNANYYTASDKLYLNVVLEDGTTAQYLVDDDGGYNFDTDKSTYMKAYAYSLNSDGSVDIIAKKQIASRESYLIKNGTVAWGTDYYSLPDAVAVWDVTDMSAAGEDATAGSFTANKVNAIVVTTTVNGKNVRTAWVWDIDEGTTPSTPIDAQMTPELYSNGTQIDIHKYAGDTLNSQQVAQIIRDQLKDVKVSKVSLRTGWGHDFQATVTDVNGDEYIYTVDYVEHAKISYNGKVEFLAQSDTMTVSSYVLEKTVAANGDVKYTKRTANISSATYTQPAVSGTSTDLVLVDGQIITMSGAPTVSFETADGKNITAHGSVKKGVAAGDVLVISGTSGDRITITKTSDSSVLATYDFTSSTSVEFEMPAYDITVTKGSTPATVEISWDATIPAGELSTTDNGSYKITCEQMTGEEGDVLVVTIELTAAVNNATTLTLSDNNSEALFNGKGSYANHTISVAANTEIGTKWSVNMELGDNDSVLKLAAANT